MTFRREHKQPIEAPREPLYDVEVSTLLERARSLGTIEVPAKLRNPHPLIVEWREHRAQQKANETLPWERRLRVQRRPTLAIHVSESQEKRACLIMDTLIKHVERLGGEIQLMPRSDPRSAVSTMVHFAGQIASSLRLRERSNMVKAKGSGAELLWSRDRTELVPNGMLIFDSGPSYSTS